MEIIDTGRLKTHHKKVLKFNISLIKKTKKYTLKIK